MAKSDGSVIIETLMDTDGFEEGLKKLEKDIDNSKDKLGGLSEPLKDVPPTLDDISGKMKDVGGTMAKVGVGMTATLTTPLVMLGKKMVSSASDMEENLNKVDVAFGKSAESVKKWSDSATESFGLSKNKALEATSLYGDMATSMGINQEYAAEMATTLAGLSGDLASFKNIGIDQAMTALNGVFTGETESLKMLGVVMTEVNLKEFAESTGLVYEEMSQAEKVQLRYNYVLEKTKNAQGDYVRTSDGTANSLRTLEASTENLSASLGEHLLPIITPIIEKLTEIVDAFGNMPEGMQKAIIVIGLVVVALGPLLTVVGSVVSIIGTLMPMLSGLSVSFNPVILAVGAAVAAVALLIANWDTAMAVMQEFDDFLQNVFAIDFTEIFGPVLGETLNAFFQNVENIWNSVKQIFSGIINFITGVFTGDWEKAWTGIKDIFGGIWELLVSVIKIPINAIIGLINGLISGVCLGINTVIKALNSINFTIPEWVPAFGGKSIGFNLTQISAPRIPYLATGAVIPPNAPFLAMLGDQRHGNNIEAPEDLIRKIVREEAGLNTEVIALLTEIVRNTRETADKDFGVSIDSRELVSAYDERKARNGYAF